MKTIAINGSSGFLGQQICKYLENKYHIVKIKREEYLEDEVILAERLKGVDIIINLAGARISLFASKKYKKVLLESRVLTTRNLVKAVNLMKRKPELFISASAIGIYDFEHFHNEFSTFYGNDFLSIVCKKWEDEVKNIEAVDTLVIRIGLVLSKNDGMLNSMRVPFKLGMGAVIGKGTQPVSFIHIDDFLSALGFAIEHRLSGNVNFVAPNFCTNLELSSALSRVLHRPLFFKIPSFLLKLVLGTQSSMLLKGQRVRPEFLLSQGFQFKYKDIDSAITNLLS
jgi:uncharacterized protein